MKTYGCPVCGKTLSKIEQTWKQSIKSPRVVKKPMNGREL
jgi:phage FluMu protein Com